MTASHPLHHILLGEQTIDYVLRRSNRRSIGFLVNHEGLRVTAPQSVAHATIERAIKSKQLWIMRKLSERQNDLSVNGSTPIALRSDSTLPYLGQPLTLKFQSNIGCHPILSEEQGTHFLIFDDTTKQSLHHEVPLWFQQQAAQIFLKQLTFFAKNLCVKPPMLKLSAAKTLWGSCSANGTIRLNWRLIHLPTELIDYVVAHELSHLREMNHSSHFWTTVASIYPNYKSARQALRKFEIQRLARYVF